MEQLTDELKNSHLDYISRNKNSNERLSWKRKHDKMQDIIKNKLEPVETKVLAALDEKNKILEEIQILRHQMIKECIHPKDYLIHNNTHITCKFCNVNLSLPRDKNGS